MEKFMSLLSPALKSQILFHMYKSIIRKIQIFDACSDIELRFVVMNMKTVIFLPNDEIIRQGDNGDNLYFISRGSAEVFIKSDEVITSEYDSLQNKTQAKSEQVDKEEGAPGGPGKTVETEEAEGNVNKGSK
jgi:hypothetical protein